MNAIAKIKQNEQAVSNLRQICLITDGNQHRDDLVQNELTFTHHDLISEAMLPEIRTIATLIASQRHDFRQLSPTQFTEEADWFAARIIVLQARTFQLDLSLKPMLDLANQRAYTFAQTHQLSFHAAKIHPSLHAKRPVNMLLMQCALSGEANNNLLENSQNVRKSYVKPINILPKSCTF